MTLKTSRVLLIHYFISYTHSFRCSPSLKSQILFLRYLRLISSGFGLSLGICILHISYFNSFSLSEPALCFIVPPENNVSFSAMWKQTKMDDGGGRENTLCDCLLAQLLLVYIWCKLHLSLKTTTSQPFFASIIFI